MAYFPDQCAKNSLPVMAALIKSLSRRGITVVPNNQAADAAVIWSVLWHGRMASNQSVYEHYRSHGRPVIIAEVGSLRRGHTWKISVNNVNASGFYGHHTDLNQQRPKQLGIQLKTAQTVSASILIAAQHGASLQLKDVDQEQWITQMIHTVKQHTDRPIVVRPHPRHRLDWSRLPVGTVCQQPKPIAHSYDDFDFDLNYHSVINYNSGPGMLAAISGVRPLVHATSLASEVGIDIQDIDRPYTIDRQPWLVRICHTEYTVDEIETGTWFDRIAPALERVV